MRMGFKGFSLAYSFIAALCSLSDVDEDCLLTNASMHYKKAEVKWLQSCFAILENEVLSDEQQWITLGNALRSKYCSDDIQWFVIQFAEAMERAKTAVASFVPEAFSFSFCINEA